MRWGITGLVCSRIELVAISRGRMLYAAALTALQRDTQVVRVRPSVPRTCSHAPHTPAVALDNIMDQHLGASYLHEPSSPHIGDVW